ncbi:MAG: hypothetical protein HQL31_05090, partial [Planctomycetes bacterium]|nr:hypothetical protein [Planctomycetota bacterium]
MLRITTEILAVHRCHYSEDWANNGDILIADDFDRLYYLEEGNAQVWSDGQMTHLKPGYFYLFPGGACKRRYRSPQGMLLNWVHFRIASMPGISLFSRYSPQIEVRAAPGDIVFLHGLIEHFYSSRPTESLDCIQSLSHILKLFLPESWNDLLPAE